MKKIFLSIAFTFCGLSQLLAVPIVINNQSAGITKPLMYDVNTYLGIVKDGTACNQTIALYYNIPLSNPNLILIDGSTIWTSPWTGNFVCISEYLGVSNCQPIPLDHNGQRVSYYNATYDNGAPLPNTYPRLLQSGFITTNQNSIDCVGMSFNLIGVNDILTQTNTSYYYESDNQIVNYQRFGNTIAVLTYH